MKAPWVNITLLIILIIQTLSGYLGMLNNESRYDWVLWIHGIGAYALVLLLFWKGTIIWDAIRRKKVWTGQRVIFLFTLLLLLLTLSLGLVWTLNGPLYFLNISFVSWHIYLAVPLMIFMLWHGWKMRFIFNVAGSRDRRALLRGGGLALAGLIVWQLSAVSKQAAKLVGATRRFTGSYERASFSNAFPRVVWIADNPDRIDSATWQLRLKGAVVRELGFTYDEMRALATKHEVATLDCTGGWYTVQSWHGVPLGDLLATAGIGPDADSVSIRSITGYQRRFTLAEANRYLLALDVAGEPLRHGHGFPLRLVAPDKRGVEWVKWITEIEVNTTAKIWQLPLPLQ